MKKIIKIFLFLFSVIMSIGINGTAYANDESAVIQAIQDRIQLLEDRESIRALLIEYGRLLDDEDLRGYSKLFAKDGVWEGGIGSARGPEGIYKMLDTVFGKMTRGQYGSSYHIMSDIMIDVSGDTASSRSNWSWIVDGTKGKPELQRSGHYEDVLIRENGIWKFKHRLTVTEIPTANKDSEAHLFRTDWEQGAEAE